MSLNHKRRTGLWHDARTVVALQLLESEEGLQLEEVARRVNLSGSRLRHVLREELGISPLRYRKQCRLLRARELVGSTFLTVKEIASAAGFTDISHFLRDYKTAFGEKPSETRRSAASATK